VSERHTEGWSSRLRLGREGEIFRLAAGVSCPF
jgi:hypothetical protein